MINAKIQTTVKVSAAQQNETMYKKGLAWPFIYTFSYIFTPFNSYIVPISMENSGVFSNRSELLKLFERCRTVRDEVAAKEIRELFRKSNQGDHFIAAIAFLPEVHRQNYMRFIEGKPGQDGKGPGLLLNIRKSLDRLQKSLDEVDPRGTLPRIASLSTTSQWCCVADGCPNQGTFKLEELIIPRRCTNAASTKCAWHFKCLQAILEDDGAFSLLDCACSRGKTNQRKRSGSDSSQGGDYSEPKKTKYDE